MKEQGYAFFVRRPRTAEELTQPHLIERERPFEIVKSVALGKTDYENFITDMLADRQFLENNAALCSRSGVWRCLLVRQRGRADGVLVLPEKERYVGWAAYFGR